MGARASESTKRDRCTLVVGPTGGGGGVYRRLQRSGLGLDDGGGSPVELLAASPGPMFSLLLTAAVTGTICSMPTTPSEMPLHDTTGSP